MANKTITVVKIFPPTQLGGWGRVLDGEQVEYSIAPVKWDGVKNELKEGSFQLYSVLSGTVPFSPF